MADELEEMLREFGAETVSPNQKALAADNDEGDNEPVDQTSADQKIDELEKQVRQLRTTGNDGQGGSPLLQELLADPDVLRLMELKRSGKKIKISDDITPIPEPELPKDPQNLQEVVQYLDKKIESTIQKRVFLEQEPVRQKVQQLEGAVRQGLVKEAEQQIEKAQKKFKDFNEYLPAIKTLYRENPGLSAEELYKVAKSRAGYSVERDPSLESERPSPETARTSTRKKSKEAVPTGRAGAISIAEDAFDAAMAKAKR